MSTIIKPKLTTEELLKISSEFADKISLSENKRTSFVKWNQSLEAKLQTMFVPYFTRKDNTRYDYLVENMTQFGYALKRKYKTLSTPEKNLQKKYWRFIAEKVKNEALELKDSYLRNSVNYFDWRVKQITD
ncbi:MAG: hypothetical protein HY841_04015 [Bacteroidetes bacterium]|nr:hypothetical protein [Bacteroidota bacterium]